MNRLIRLSVTSVLASAACAAVTPAQAHVGDGVAIGAGILGLGIGAAIASHPHHYYYGDGYYAPPPPPPVVYYAPPPPPPPPPPSYAYETVQRCRVVNQWDGYYGRYVQTRHCW